MAENCKCCCSFTKWENPVTSGVAYLLISFTLLYAMFCPECNPVACFGNSIILCLLGIKAASSFGFIQVTDKQELIPSAWFEGDLLEELFTCANQTVARFHRMAATATAPVLAATLFGVIMLAELLGTLGLCFWTTQVVFGTGALKAFMGIDVSSQVRGVAQQLETQFSNTIKLIPRASSVIKKE